MRIDGVLAVSRGLGDFPYKANKGPPRARLRCRLVPPLIMLLYTRSAKIIDASVLF
jgi:hypothetical protein